MTWKIETAEYQGEGYWADYPPLEFATKEEAESFATLVNATQQTKGLAKVRRLYEEKRT